MINFVKRSACLQKQKSFSYLPAEGPVNLKNPDVTFQYIEYYGTVANNPPEEPYVVFFGRLVCVIHYNFIL